MCLLWEEGAQPKWKLHTHLNIFVLQERLQRNHIMTSIVCSSYISSMVGIICDHSPVYPLRQRVSVELRAQQISSLSGLPALGILCLCILRLELPGGTSHLLGVYVGSADLNVSPLAYMTRALMLNHLLSSISSF